MVMHSPEVELTEIFVSNIFNGNGLAPSDMPPDTKNTTRGVHNFQILEDSLISCKIGCFKDLTLRTSFFGVMPIVIPFRKALGSPVLMAPRYRPKNQWV